MGIGLAQRAEWDEGEAQRIIGRMVQRKRPMFAAFPEHDREDLQSIALLAVRAAWPKFNPDRGSRSTFIYRVGACQLLDLYRVRSRQGEREAMAAAINLRAQMAAPPREEDEPAELAAWLSETYRTIARNLVRYGVPIEAKGIERPDRAQVAALLALQRRLKLPTMADVWERLSDCPKLAAAVDLDSLPTPAEFQRVRGGLLRVDFTARRAVTIE